jgi:hypothetical protein
MSLLTEGMRQTDERVISAGQLENGNWAGYEMVNHPSPSGNERWMMTYSDKREWPDKETAIREFTAILPKPLSS